jgi:heme/copper-type cytochrome/quinol oxidase subunit 3
MTSHAAGAETSRYEPTSFKVPDKKLGMWIFLASEVMFFTGLIGSYIILRWGASSSWPEPGEVLNVPITAANTFLLICSSVTMVKAFAAIEEGNQKMLKTWLLTTAIIGAAFVGVQAYEYTELVNHNFLPSEGLYGSTFFTMTGFHGLHVTIGVLCMLWVTKKAFRGDYTQENHEGVEIIGLYWHFVDLERIILFTIVYLI